MSLLDLPDELILSILCDMDPSNNDSIASVNRRINKISHSCPWIQRRRAARSNCRAVTFKFGHPYTTALLSYETNPNDARLDWHRPIDGRAPTAFYNSLTYLDLQDDLAWFEPEAPLENQWAMSLLDCKIEDLTLPAPATRFEDVVDTATSLGLSIPNSMLLLLSNDPAHRQFTPTSMQHHFLIGRLMRYGPSEASTNQAYLLRFCETSTPRQHSHTSLLLYLDQQGHHCVLASSLEIPQDVLASEESVPLAPHGAEDLELFYPSFETFWAHQWFQESIGVAEQYCLPLSEAQRRYCEHLPCEAGGWGRQYWGWCAFDRFLDGYCEF